MPLTEGRTCLRIVSWCHLNPLRIDLPHLPIDSQLFPSAKEGFEGFSMAHQTGWFGAKRALVDIAGLTRQEVREHVSQDFGDGIQVEPMDFLRALEWVSKGKYDTPFHFDRIIAYVSGAESAVAVPVEGGGFRRVPYQGDDVPWEPGTLGLFIYDSL